VRAAVARPDSAENIDPFHRMHLSLVTLVHSTTSGRLSQTDPIGGFVTNAVKLRVDQRLQKQRAITVNELPVFG